jgi:hypothetical protein
VLQEGFFFGSDTLIAPGNRVPLGKEALATGASCLRTPAHCTLLLALRHPPAEVESYMEEARAACLSVMRVIVRTGLLTYLGEGEDEPEAFVAAYLANPVYMLKALK